MINIGDSVIVRGIIECPNITIDGHTIDKNKLIEILKAEEEGRLLALPCKVGDKVYAKSWDENTYCKSTVTFLMWNNETGLRIRYIPDIKDDSFIRWTDQSLYGTFNKTVFLTKPEAEQALKEMEGAE